MCSIIKFIPLIIICTFSCNKEEREIDKTFWSSEWLIGDWKFSEGVQMNGTDTVNYYKDDKLFVYYNSGIRVPISYSYSILISFREDGTYKYQEILDPIMLQNMDILDSTLFNFVDNWEWLNTTRMYTHLHFKFLTRITNYPSIHRLFLLTDSTLVIQSENNGGIYKFKKIGYKNSTVNDDSDKLLQDVYPLDIVSNWHLVEFHYYTNDSVFMKLSNDTLINQDYQCYYRHCNSPSDLSKEVDIIPHKFDIEISQLGYFSSILTENNITTKRNSVWYWSDNNEIHKQIRIQPSGLLNAFFYNILKLDDDSLILQDTYSRRSYVYRFTRN